MQERIKEILTQERLSPARFAELVGVQRSSVSHIISGRNKPSLDFLQKILTHFEHISPDWLITGKGPYKRSDLARKQTNAGPTSSGSDGKIVFPSFSSSAREEEKAIYNTKQKQEASESIAAPENLQNKEETPPVNAEPENKIPSEPATGAPKKIIKTLLFYDDNTFEVFFPHYG